MIEQGKRRQEVLGSRVQEERHSPNVMRRKMEEMDADAVEFSTENCRSF